MSKFIEMFSKDPNQMTGNQPLMEGTNPAPMLGGRPTGYAANPLEEIGQAVTATVKQQIELFEMFTGCQTRNRYHIFITNRAGVQTYLFKGKESSNCCQRNCYPPGFRPYEMRLRHMSSSDSKDDFSGYYAKFEKPCKLACCCFCRPVSTGKYWENEVPFGKIVEPCVICSPAFEVYDSNGEVKYKIILSWFQCGFLCRATWFGPCFDTHLKIVDRDGKNVGSVLKKARGIRGLISDCDTFTITFPDNASAQDKMTLLGGTIMIDYSYFENDDRSCLQKCFYRC